MASPTASRPVCRSRRPSWTPQRGHAAGVTRSDVSSVRAGGLQRAGPCGAAREARRGRSDRARGARRFVSEERSAGHRERSASRQVRRRVQRSVRTPRGLRGSWSVGRMATCGSTRWWRRRSRRHPGKATPGSKRSVGKARVSASAGADPADPTGSGTRSSRRATGGDRPVRDEHWKRRHDAGATRLIVALRGWRAAERGVAGPSEPSLQPSESSRSTVLPAFARREAGGAPALPRERAVCGARGEPDTTRRALVSKPRCSTPAPERVAGRGLLRRRSEPPLRGGGSKSDEEEPPGRVAERRPARTEPAATNLRMVARQRWRTNVMLQEREAQESYGHGPSATVGRRYGRSRGARP